MAFAGPGTSVPITFMSNVHMELFQNNAVTQFRNRIEKYVFFNGNRRNPGTQEMALMECHVPVNYKNVTVGRCRLYMRRTETAVTSRDGATPANPTVEFAIPAGYYGDIAQLVALLTKQLDRAMVEWSTKGDVTKTKRETAAIQLLYDATSGRVTLRFNAQTAGLCDILFSNDLTRILGFGDGSSSIVSPPLTTPRNKYSSWTGPNTATVVGCNPQLFLYCSAVKPSQLANNMVNLLAILPWRPGRDVVHTTQNIAPLNPVWRPLIDEDFSDISFHVTDANGREVALYGANIILSCQVRTRTVR